MDFQMISTRKNEYKLITAKPFAPNLGAEIYGVDLSKPVPDAQFEEVKRAFWEYQVLFF
jgi:taurine dioxygenase